MMKILYLYLCFHGLPTCRETFSMLYYVWFKRNDPHVKVNMIPYVKLHCVQNYYARVKILDNSKNIMTKTWGLKYINKYYTCTYTICFVWEKINKLWVKKQ